MRELPFDLLCTMTDDELLERGNTLSSTSQEYDRVEEQKKTAMKEFGEELKELRGSIRRLAFNIRRKAEMRTVKCAVDYHSPVQGTKRITRLDTGEFVRDEPMSAEEHQNNLFEDAPAVKGKKA